MTHSNDLVNMIADTVRRHNLFYVPDERRYNCRDIDPDQPCPTFDTVPWVSNRQSSFDQCKAQHARHVAAEISAILVDFHAHEIRDEIARHSVLISRPVARFSLDILDGIRLTPTEQVFKDELRKAYGR